MAIARAVMSTKETETATTCCCSLLKPLRDALEEEERGQAEREGANWNMEDRTLDQHGS